MEKWLYLPIHEWLIFDVFHVGKYAIIYPWESVMGSWCLENEAPNGSPVIAIISSRNLTPMPWLCNF